MQKGHRVPPPELPELAAKARRLCDLALVLAAMSLVAADSHTVLPHTDELLIQGTWELVSAKDNGVDFGTDRNRIVVAGSRWNAKGDSFTYRLFPHKRPKQVDWTLNGKLSEEGIYEFNGDILLLCLSKPGGPRPTEFETISGDGRRMHVRRRVDPDPR
jgi:uncharacterized protein (TIGR03067 family)